MALIQVVHTFTKELHTGHFRKGGRKRLDSGQVNLLLVDFKLPRIFIYS